jgi:serine/threonine protein kinase
MLSTAGARAIVACAWSNDQMTDPTDSVSPGATPPGLPREIGGYRILRVLGSGGMATVYAAQQQSPRRVVALKVMRTALATHADGQHGSQVRATRRFNREVQILGKLRHQWIAQVFEAGTHDDGSGALPFFVMEYIPGARTLLEFAAWKDLALRDRLKLFVKICSAVQHGHNARIIHRDLKPANILVDEHGEPKVIDFGVAQAADVDLSMQTLHADVGRLIGTIQYMSPEQVDGRPRNLTPASDVYALGVLLYRLVCMKMPYDLEGLPIHQAARVICTEAPRLPSSTRPVVRGDLETILLKAMEKQPHRRYPNAGSLGRDLVRYLASKPIHARRAGWMYRGALFLQRHRAAAVFSVTATALIAASIIITALLASRRSGVGAPFIDSSHLDAPPTRGPASSIDETTTRDVSAQSSQSSMGKPLRLAEHVNAIAGLALDPLHSTLYSSGLDHRIMVWDLENHRLAHRIDDHEGAVTALALSDDGSLLATADEDGIVHVRDAMTREAVSSSKLTSESIGAIDFSPDRRLIAACAEDLTIRLWDRDRGEIQTLRGSSGAFGAVAFDADGQHLAAGSAGGPLYVFDVAGDSPARQLLGHAAPIVALAWLHDGNRIASVSRDGGVCIWNLDDESLQRQFRVGGGNDDGSPREQKAALAVHCAAISTEHQLIAGSLSNVEVGLWRLHDGHDIQTFQTEERASRIIFDRQSRTLIIGEESGDILVVEWPPADQ